MEFTLTLSSMQRAGLARLQRSVFDLLERPQVQMLLVGMNKGEIRFIVRDGIAIEVSPTSDLRIGKELEPSKEERDDGNDAG